MYVLKLIWRFIRELALAWRESYATSMGAALAYYTAFSIAPLFLLFVSLTSLFFAGDARRLIAEEVSGLTGPAGAAAVEPLLKSGIPPTDSVEAVVIGAVALFAGAMSVFVELQKALDRIWQLPPFTRGRGAWALIRARFLSLGLVGGFGFLLVVSLGVSASLAGASTLYGELFAGWFTVLRVVDLVVHYVALVFIFSCIYKVLPSARIRWHDARVGGVVTATLFLTGKIALNLYITHNRALVSYGFAGALLVVLIWIFYSAQIVLFGAVFTRVYGEVRQSERHRSESAPLPSTRATDVF